MHVVMEVGWMGPGQGSRLTAAFLPADMYLEGVMYLEDDMSEIQLRVCKGSILSMNLSVY